MTEANPRESLLNQLDAWHQVGWLRAIDVSVAHLLAATESDPRVLLAAALVSHQAGRGHTCVSLQALCEDIESTLAIPPYQYHAEAVIAATGQPLLTPTELLQSSFTSTEPALLQQQWLAALQASDAVTEHPEQDAAPFVLLDSGQSARLYLRRYWRYEQRIQSDLEQRLSKTDAVDKQALTEALQLIFPDPEKPKTKNSADWQKIACANAIKYPFSVITGGPGTGKTYTVVRLLALLQNLAPTPLRIALAAPTGKAAARLKESISGALEGLPERLLRHGAGSLPTHATTLHRLLGPQRHSRRFKHHNANPLRVDVVVVDEASMVDIEMLDALLDALPANARLILLGDKDQLASVEAGAILAALCEGAEQGHYRPEHFDWLQQVSGEAIPPEFQDASGSERMQAVVMLRDTHRFEGPIADLAKAINNRDVQGSREVLAAGAQKDHHLSPVQVIQPELSAHQTIEQRQQSVLLQLQQLVVQGYAGFKQAHSTACPATDEATVNVWATDILDQFATFQLLSAVKQGPWGQRGLNRQVTEWLGGKVDAWYHGRPVMITSNDYSLNVRNGDIGVALRHPADGLLKVALFAEGTESGTKTRTVRWLLPSRLAQIETVYAMTVHKSQGSEFKHTVMVLPDRLTPVLTKELLYTGITRARKRLTLVVPDQAVLEGTIARKITRVGGLFSAAP